MLGWILASLDHSQGGVPRSPPVAVDYRLDEAGHVASGEEKKLATPPSSESCPYSLL